MSRNKIVILITSLILVYVIVYSVLSRPHKEALDGGKKLSMVLTRYHRECKSYPKMLDELKRDGCGGAFESAAAFLNFDLKDFEYQSDGSSYTLRHPSVRFEWSNNLKVD